MRPTPFHSSRQLGAALRAARERDGRSQGALARSADVERQWLVLLETGKLDNPTLRNVFKVADALNLHLEIAGRDDESKLDPGQGLDELMGQ